MTLKTVEKKPKYLFIKKRLLEELQNEVNKRVNEGYDLHGRMEFENVKNDLIEDTFYIQQMILTETK